MLRDSEHIAFGSNIIIMHALVIDCINQYTKFQVPSFTSYKDIDWRKILGKVCYHRQGFDTDHLRAKFDDSSLSHSRHITGGVEIESGSRDPDHAPF